MNNRLLWGVIICFLRPGLLDGKDAGITQTPRNLITGIGQNVMLKCKQNLGHETMYWYRQDLGQELKLIYFSITRGDIQKGDIPKGYNVTRKEKEIFALLMPSASTKQTSFYLCATSL
uniref:Immunoglobulin V-set domain-containing protein n=1 Tax=Sarcophilus harrisii TaxID=9305 RepID=G3VQU0_SARHA